MPDHKSRREHAARIVKEAAKSAPAPVPTTDYELALRSATIAEGAPREELVRRIVCEWLKGRGYLK